jgi:hypothetical protein
MAQTMYTHMNKEEEKEMKKNVYFPPYLTEVFLFVVFFREQRKRPI